jgi:hypothetical protein
VDVFPAMVGLLVGRQTDHGWKHIQLSIYTETGGCDCSLKELLMMGRNMLSSVYAIKQYILRLIVAFGWVFYLNI